jgi:two-component system, OmpR family, sensor histidine kinase VicK
VEILSAPLHTEKGTLVSSAIRDITDRKRLEHDASHLAAVVQSSTDAIIGKDLDGLITSWSRGAERLFGYSEKDMLGQTISLLIPAHHTDDLPELLRQIRSGHRVGDYETVRARMDGTLVNVLLTISPILGRDGRVVGASTIARDISDRRRAEQLKDEFLAMVSHELRTPLSSIVARVELLLEDDLPELTRRQFMEVITRASGRLQRLVGDLLFVAQLDSADPSLSMSEVDLVSVANEAIDAAATRAAEAGIQLTLETGNDKVTLTGDCGRLGQALDNLISNAITHSLSGGAVTVRILPGADNCDVEVEDNGIGISEHDQERLFERFFRTSHAVAAQIPGVGLGLLIVKTIIHGHGGRVQVYSLPGAGATFRMTVPLCQPSQQLATPPPRR